MLVIRWAPGWTSGRPMNSMISSIPTRRMPIDHLPHGVVGEDAAQPLGLEAVERVGVASRELDDLEPIER